MFSPLRCWVSWVWPSPLRTAPARRPLLPGALGFSLCSLAVFQSPSPGSASPLGAESSSTPLHPSDPTEASTNKEVGRRFLSKAVSPFSSTLILILILIHAFSSLPQSFCPKVPWGGRFRFHLSSVEFGDESRDIQFGSYWLQMSISVDK